MRSTLLPSLRDEFYRLPENALPDVLVFRGQDLSPLPKNDRFFVDVILRCTTVSGSGGWEVRGRSGP